MNVGTAQPRLLMAALGGLIALIAGLATGEWVTAAVGAGLIIVSGAILYATR